MPPELRTAVFALPPGERLKLAEELWDSVDEDDHPLSQAQLEELDRRMQAHRENPERAIPGDEFLRRLEDRYGR